MIFLFVNYSNCINFLLMLKVSAYILTVNLFISTFYQLMPFCSKVGANACTAGVVIFGMAVVLLILNLLTTSSMFFLVQENSRIQKPLKAISLITLAFTITFLLAFFNEYFIDCLLLFLPLLLINGLVIALSFSSKLRAGISQ